jgi:NDP-sugar pyrophosphorylase family protein
MTNLLDPPTRAIVLAAGRGRRLRPFTDRRPKPLLPESGRPALDYVLTALSRAGVNEVCLVTHYLAEQIQTYVGNGAAWDMHAVFRRQSELLGAAHAVQAAVDFIKAPTFILAADYLLPGDYLAELKLFYLRERADLAVSLKRLPDVELGRRSSVRFNGLGRIQEIVEKPAPGTAPSQIGASMIYIVPPTVLDYLPDVPRSSRGEYEFQWVVNRMLRDGYRMAGCIQSAPPEWTPVNNDPSSK